MPPMVVPVPIAMPIGRAVGEEMIVPAAIANRVAAPNRADTISTVVCSGRKLPLSDRRDPVRMDVIWVKRI